MPVLGLKLDNVLCFNGFRIDFSYPRKLKVSLVENENLTNISSFRYKKVNVFVGSNASGKTSLLKCIWSIFLFLSRKEKNILYRLIDEKNSQSNIEMDFVSSEGKNSYLYRVKIIANYVEDDVKLAYKCILLKDDDSYEKIIKKMDNAKYTFENYVEALETFNANIGWNIVLPGTEENFDIVKFCRFEDEKEGEYISIMNDVFKTLDPSIVKVSKSKDSDDAYVIEHATVGKIIAQEGMQIRDLKKLSSGTKYGFNIANIIFSIKNCMNGIYLIDEQFSYVNSDIEKAFISTIITLLKDDEQVFITTHNSDVLELRLPFHSFYFMSRNNYSSDIEITCNCASEIENRNNVSPRTIIDNDMFGSSPNVSMINKMGE